MKKVNVMDNSDNSYYNFEESVRKTFSFLIEIGFYEIEAFSTIVRYRKGDVVVDVYQGPKSFEIGAGVTAFGTRYAISEIIRVVAPEIIGGFKYKAVTSSEGVFSALEELSYLLNKFGHTALKGDTKFFSILQHQRKQWAEEYALDVLVEQLRPQAEEAFRQKDYSKAADLYSRIRNRLSPAEVRKLIIAEKRSRG